MKATALIIALFPVLCFAQQTNTALTKPATDACPTFKKGKQPSKADYFRSLRTVKKAAPNTNSELAYNTPEPVPAKKQSPERPSERPAAQKQTSYTPSFTGSDMAAEPKKTTMIPEKEKAIAPPAAEKAIAKTDAAEKAVSSENTERVKTKAKRKATKHNTCSTPKKTKKAKGNNEKCPAF